MKCILDILHKKIIDYSMIRITWRLLVHQNLKKSGSYQISTLGVVVCKSLIQYTPPPPYTSQMTITFILSSMLLWWRFDRLTTCHNKVNHCLTITASCKTQNSHVQCCLFQLSYTILQLFDEIALYCASLFQGGFTIRVQWPKKKKNNNNNHVLGWYWWANALIFT